MSSPKTTEIGDLIYTAFKVSMNKRNSRNNRDNNSEKLPEVLCPVIMS
jgi:hypothetical protein